MIRIIIRKPVLTEKSMQKVALNQYTFEVDLSANKKEISQEVEKLYKVKVMKIQTLVRKGKLKSSGKRRNVHRTPTRKFAVVTVQKDQKIEEFKFLN